MRYTGKAMGSFEAAVSALAYSAIERGCADAGSRERFPHNRVARYVLDSVARLAPPIRRRVRLGTALLDLLTLPRHGRRFHRLPSELRRRALERWRRSPIPPVRDLVRFYDALSVFAWHADAQGPL